jgi:hypothetical protein
MGLLRVIVSVVQNEEHLQFFKDKQIVKGLDLHDLFTGHIENSDLLSSNEHEKMVFREFHSRVSFAEKRLTESECHGWPM